MASMAQMPKEEAEKDEPAVRQRPRRKLWARYQPANDRVRYLRDVFFFGSTSVMASACAIFPHHLTRVLYGHSNLTIKMAASIVQRLGVSAEWLVCGSGSVFSPTAPHKELFVAPKKTSINALTKQNCLPTVALELPTQFASSWLADFDNDAVTCLDPLVPFAGYQAAAPTPPSAPDYSAAAAALYQARAESCCASFFLAASGLFPAAYDALLPLLRYAHADFAVLTLSAVFQDLLLSDVAPSFDVHDAARQAFRTGIGYGEALAQQLQLCTAPSMAATLAQRDFPFFVAAEIGELGQHSGPAICGAELGAAVGAAAYADSLGVTESLRRLRSGCGGVFVLLGEPVRGARFYLQRLLALKAAGPFTFIVFSAPDASLAAALEKHGGRPIFLGPPTPTAYQHFHNACLAIYTN